MSNVDSIKVNGYESEDLEQLLKDMESYKEVPKELFDHGKVWDYDDALELEMDVEDLIKVWNKIHEAPSDYIQQFGIVSAVTGNDVPGAGLAFKSITGEIDVVIIYDTDYAEILYGFEIAKDKDPGDDEDVEDTMPDNVIKIPV